MKTPVFDKTDALYERALRTIPLGSQTFSKSAMNFVAGASPLFLERGLGARVWDVDGNEYIDYMLGLLPIVLGYCDPDVDGAIRRQLDRGITFSLSTELEADLAERLVRLIPCAEMVRFAKNGSDATSAAIRLARGYTGRDRVAVCGYHGWHDWYIGTTSRHLGVPDAVRELSSTFRFNDADGLSALLQAAPDEYAAVILEPASYDAPQAGFLEALRSLTEKYGTILIFDEVVTGFRLDMGGAQKHYDVTPDLACFGKAMANGMPISALVGRRDIMAFVEKIFFSGTFAGEALSLAAAIATIDKMEAENAVARIQKVGERVGRAASSALDRHGLSARLKIKGPSWHLAVAACDAGDAGVVASSLLRQELVANGILMGTSLSVCLAHDDEEVIARTEASWSRAAEAVATAYATNSPGSFLRGKPIQPIFQVREV